MTGSELRVVVLAGGLSYEREVSDKSGQRIADAVRAAGHDVRVLDTDPDLLPALAADPPDAIFIALHGAAGEDGSLRAVLDTTGLGYVGSPAGSCRIAWDKPTAKTLLRAAGLPTPDWLTLSRSTFRELGAPAILTRVVKRLGLPLVLKPAQGGSALGVVIVPDAAQLPAALVGTFAYGDTVLIEEHVAGREVAVSVVEPDGDPLVLPAVGIRAASGVYDYAARYTPGLTTYETPVHLDRAVLTDLQRTCLAAHRVLRLRDLSRIDVIVTGAGTPMVLEVNVSPGLTDTSLLPIAVQAAGRDLGELAVSLLRRAVARSAHPSAAVQRESTVD